VTILLLLSITKFRVLHFPILIDMPLIYQYLK
jgi:hypothetical protein